MGYIGCSRTGWCVLAGLSTAIVSSTTAFAAEGESDALQEVVVTAQFREQRLQDTPLAITAVNAEMLEARGQTSIAQVAAQAPNVSLRPQPQGGGSGLIAYIRGVGQTDFNYALDPGVGVYIDDVYIPTLSSSLLELIDLDRVEILRGPQGTLAGKNAIGGAIKLFSAKPKGDDTGMLRVSYGSFNELTLRGMADMKITDTLAFRVSGMSRSNDGYVGMLDYGQTHPGSNVPQNTTRGRGNSDYQTMGGQNIVAGRAALRWTPSDPLEINLSYDYTRERSEAIPTVLIAAGAIAPGGTTFNPSSVGASNSAGNPWLRGKNGQAVNMSCAFVPAGAYSCDTGAVTYNNFDPRFVSYSNFLDGMAPTATAPFKPYFAVPETVFQGSGVQGTATYDFNDQMQLTYIGSYREYNSKFGQDQDATPIPVAQLDNELNHHAFTSEVRLNMKSAKDFVEGTVGAFYLDQEGTYTARIRNRVLDLTFKEFELIKYLAQHPGRVFTRAQLLQEVWGYDYFGGTRTVDVHVRRLRAKLGPEHESLIGTVRNVGYRFVTPEKADRVAEEAKATAERAKMEDTDTASVPDGAEVPAEA